VEGAVKLLTITDLIQAGFPTDKPIILQDPDTDWILVPVFSFDDEHVIVSGDYRDRLPELDR
jgi:hypothetical protein